MGKTYAELDATLTEFLAAQQMFFVATAPRDLSIRASTKAPANTIRWPMI